MQINIEDILDKIGVPDTDSLEDLVCDQLHDMGMPILAEYSTWYQYQYNHSFEDMLIELVENNPEVGPDDLIDMLANKVYKIYVEWLESPKVKEQVAELRENEYFINGEDVYGDSHTADLDGWPDNSNMSEDPDYIQRIINWYPESMFYYDDEDEDEYEDEENEEDGEMLDDEFSGSGAMF